MPFIRSLASKHLTLYFKLVAVILLFSKIMLTCSHYIEIELVYITIITLFSYQPSFYTKCTKSNIYSFCNMRFIFNTKYIFFICLYAL